MSHSLQPECKSIVVGIGEYHISDMPMSTIGLGSCIALIIHDSRKNVGAMAHVMLPESRGRIEHLGKYADTAVSVLVKELRSKGSSKTYLTAKIIGGASMFKLSNSNLNIGKKNTEVIISCLKEHNISIDVTEVGGNFGRSLVYYPKQGGKVFIKQADGIKKEL